MDQNNPAGDDRRFDLLVDGELSEAARRELLSGLDDDPVGWRRCALAFLEAQCWRKEFGGLARESSPERPPSRPASRFRLNGLAGTLLAMATTFVLAWVLGGLVQGIRNPGSPGRGPTAGTAIAEGETGSGAHKRGAGEGRLLGPAGNLEAGPSEVWVVELPGGMGPEGEAETIRLPVMEQDQLGENWLKSLPGPLSPELLEQLQKAGLRVEQHRRLLPWRMKDGRRLVVPVDEVYLHYVGNPTL